MKKWNLKGPKNPGASGDEMKGYVYILEVKDIVLPVCKIGMTERNPRQRCVEINSGSTGDFIWEVAHHIFVNDCRSFESLVHAKLEPLRQKRREFFNIGPDAAYDAIVSILDSQEDIKKIDPGDGFLEDDEKPLNERRPAAGIEFREMDTDYADLLQLFTYVLGVKGKPFGQLNTPSFGISDGARGVQWHLVVHRDTGEVRLGVNLEGSENTGKWLIADFLRSEPKIETLVSKVATPSEISFCLTRDAWQGPARLNIKEKYIGGKEFVLSEVDRAIWHSLIEESLTCLDEDRGFRGRKKRQLITLESNGRELTRDVSPHLTFWKTLQTDGDAEKTLRKAISDLTPVYDWVVEACGTE